MNISTLAKTLGVSLKELRDIGQKNSIYGFSGRNTRIPYNSALEITKILKPEKLSRLKNDDKIYLPATISVADLAETIGKPSGLVVKNLLMSGVMVTLNEKIDYDTASLISEELGVEVHPEEGGDFDQESQENTQMVRTVEYAGPDSEKVLVDRNPVITIMGHVDHGKTTLLDYIRQSNVVSSEAGSITQHISSYKINYQGKDITFVDTPGHEAFTAMRARGSQLADFVILVVSAVEGPKPQTVEVVERSKMSKVPVIVAINKVDLPEADPERVKVELTKFGLTPEEWGGETPFVPISAKTGEGIDKLLETILTYAEVAELKGEVDCPGQGIIIESHRDRSLGVVATMLIVKDKVKVGDIIRGAEYVGKVRKLISTTGKEISEASIGDPVILIGLPEILDIGEPVITYKNNKEAQKDAAEEAQKRAAKVVRVQNSTTSGDGSYINLVLRADVNGSLEALKESIIKIPQDKVKVVIKSEGVGEVNESDIEFAQTAQATILAFHTEVSSKAENILKKTEVNIVQSKIIYELLEWLESEILKNTKRETKVVPLGKAEVLATFSSDKPNLQIIGGEVKEGKIINNKQVFVHRDGVNLGKLEINELQRNKDQVNEVFISQQFGLSLQGGKLKIKKGDILECFDEVVI
jgi:translation initiation factor IF-2